MAGRKPLPTALKVMRGNPGKRPLNTREPKFKAVEPKPLDCLSVAARSHFKNLVALLLPTGVATEADAVALSALAQAIATYAEATAELEMGPKVVATERGMARSPWFTIQKQALEQMNRGFTDYGLTASARTRLAPPAAGHDESEARFFGT